MNELVNGKEGNEWQKRIRLLCEAENYNHYENYPPKHWFNIWLTMFLPFSITITYIHHLAE